MTVDCFKIKDPMCDLMMTLVRLRILKQYVLLWDPDLEEEIVIPIDIYNEIQYNGR